jgi:protein-L-isoaspartate(D-aspartate) O-methyltransferase
VGSSGIGQICQEICETDLNLLDCFDMKDKRKRMVEDFINKYGNIDQAVTSSMLQVPREKFVPLQYRSIAYNDCPVPIGFGQTMSQPYTVAFMTHLLLDRDRARVGEGEIINWKVLEVGTGSGYQAAVLSKLVKEVYSVEIIPQLAKRADSVLKKLGYENVFVKSGSGEWGRKEKAPFDAIIVTAGIEEKVPDELFRQLAEGGVLVAPVGSGYEKVMTRYVKTGKQGKEEIKVEKFGIFRFVPFIVS